MENEISGTPLIGFSDIKYEYKFIRTGNDSDVHEAAKNGWKIISIQWQVPGRYDENLTQLFDVVGEWSCVVMEKIASEDDESNPL